ncbi:MAG TPA: hypothetical protein VFK22_01375 [Candidatus Dormibacteraeota bacterium]|nr:hypothetical protein [Candidatus Dormibacteraeota bacterium]
MRALRTRLADRRSGRVVFAPHCLLNENVRYLGGACRPGPVNEWLDRWAAEGVGICQMPCPEQRAWGGVAKPRLAPAYGSRGTPMWPVRRWLMRIFVLYTRIRYAFIARRVVGEMQDYQRSGYRVAGLVGVAGSPSCGITRTLDVDNWLEMVAGAGGNELSSELVNRAVISSARPGQGWFVSAILCGIKRRRIVVPLAEHDLIAELAEPP